MPIPNILDEISANYDFIGHVGDCSVKTDLRSMLLNMHDYNHQNGTYRQMFKITLHKCHPIDRLPVFVRELLL